MIREFVAMVRNCSLSWKVPVWPPRVARAAGYQGGRGGFRPGGLDPSRRARDDPAPATEPLSGMRSMIARNASSDETSRIGGDGDAGPNDAHSQDDETSNRE